MTMTTTTRRLRKARPVADLSVAQLTLTELHQELQRRVTDLMEQKEELQQKIEAINRELTALGSLGGGGNENGRSGNGRRNPVPLATMLVEILSETPMTTRDASEAALAQGYLTNSRNFQNNVSVALHKDPRFEKTDGQWHVVDVPDA